MQFEKLGEDLEDEGGELGDVLLEDGLEGREEGRLELGEGRGNAGGNEAVRSQRSVTGSRVQGREHPPNERRDTLEGEVVELGVRRVLGDLAEDADEVRKDGNVDGSERLASRDDDAHDGCEVEGRNELASRARRQRLDVGKNSHFIRLSLAAIC